MPMHKFRRIGIVDHLYRHRLAFAHAQHRSWCNSVVADRGENVRAVEFHRNRGDAQRVVRRRLRCPCAGSPGREAARLPLQPAPKPCRPVSGDRACSRFAPRQAQLHRLMRKSPRQVIPTNKELRPGCLDPRKSRRRRLQPTSGSFRLTGKRPNGVRVLLRTFPVAEVHPMKFSRLALPTVTAAVCCAGLWRFSADRRFRLWKRRFSHQRQGGVLLVAPGLRLAIWRSFGGFVAVLAGSFLVARLPQGRPPVPHRHAPAHPH